MNYGEFEKLVKDSGGNAKKYSQQMYMTNNPWLTEYQNALNEGVCRALSAAYILHNRIKASNNNSNNNNNNNNNSNSNTFEDLKKMTFSRLYDFNKRERERSEDDLKRFGTIAAAQEKFYRSGKIEDKALIEAATGTVAELGNGILKYSMDSPVVTTSIGGKGVTGETLNGNGYWLISAGKHMMAVTIRTSVSEGMKFKFFDPNYGQAIFRNFEKLLEFLNRFLNEQNYDELFFIRFV